MVYAGLKHKYTYFVKPYLTPSTALNFKCIRDPRVNLLRTSLLFSQKISRFCTFSVLIRSKVFSHFNNSDPVNKSSSWRPQRPPLPNVTGHK